MMVKISHIQITQSVKFNHSTLCLIKQYTSSSQCHRKRIRSLLLLHSTINSFFLAKHRANTTFFFALHIMPHKKGKLNFTTLDIQLSLYSKQIQHSYTHDFISLPTRPWHNIHIFPCA